MNYIESVKKKGKITNILRAAEYAEKGGCNEIAIALFEIALKEFEKNNEIKFSYIPLDKDSVIITEKEFEKYVMEKIEDIKKKIIR